MKILKYFGQVSLGVDIQPEAVLILSAKRFRQAVTIERQLKVELPAGLVADGLIQDWQTFTALLRRLVDAHQLQGMPTTICLPVERVSIQYLQLPMSLTDAEIEHAIQHQLQRDLPGLNEKLYHDFYCIYDILPRQMEVIYAAVRAEEVRRYIDSFQDAGLMVKVVDVDIFALLRAAIHLSKASTPEEIAAAVYAARNRAILVVFESNRFLCHQQWEWTAENDFLSGMRLAMQASLSRIGQKSIRRLFYFGGDDYFGLLSDVSLSFAVEIERLAPADFADGDRFSSSVLAYGLALREMPAW